MSGSKEREQLWWLWVKIQKIKNFNSNGGMGKVLCGGQLCLFAFLGQQVELWYHERWQDASPSAKESNPLQHLHFLLHFQMVPFLFLKHFPPCSQTLLPAQSTPLFSGLRKGYYLHCMAPWSHFEENIRRYSCTKQPAFLCAITGEIFLHPSNLFFWLQTHLYLKNFPKNYTKSSCFQL